MDGIETGQADMRDGLAATNEHPVRIETVQAEHGRRLTRIESTQAEHGARLGRIEDELRAVEAAQAGPEDGQAAARGDPSATNERLARVEGTAADAPARATP